MTDTIARALSLLNLLQTHRHWPGSELARRLGVTDRTVRRDVERLRDLGYRIESVTGAAGGYRLEAGSAVPPLLLTDEEAVAMAIGLRVAASQRLVGGPETTLTALAKLEQVLPAPLRRRVNALAGSVQPTAIRSGAPVSTDVIADLALACRDHERVRFIYSAANGVESHRRVEPYALAPADRHWYLLCWDLEREDWRTFRVDRVTDVSHTRVLFTPRALAPEEVEAKIVGARSWAPRPLRADVVMHLPLDQVRDRFGDWSCDARSEGATSTRWPVEGADGHEVIHALSFIPDGVECAIDVAEPARSELRTIIERMLRALDAPPPPSRSDTQRHRRSQ